MKHLRFLSWCASTPWAMMPEAMSAAALLLGNALSREISSGLAVDIKAGPKEPIEARAPVKQNQSTGGGQIAVVPVVGTIVPRASQLDMCEEGTSTAQIRAQLADANANPQVSQILLMISSPGGSVYDVPELCAEIANNAKPVVSYVSDLAASAGYWIGCSAGEMYAAPSSEVGSIGVWSAHQNVADMLKQKGVDITLISAGKYKVEGNPFGPLSDDAKAHMLSRVQDYYGMFTKGVAKGRKVGIDAVRSGMGQGRVLGADQAKGENMIDGVMTLDAVIAQMQKNIKSAAKTGASRVARANRTIAMLN